MTERKPDGGLAERIEFIEMVGSPDDAELLCLLLELRRHREDKPALIEQLEAAQRAEGEAKSRIAELDRQWEFRSPTPDAYEAACKALEKHRQRADAAEAELKRRDAQEPVAWRLINAPEAAVSVTDNGKMAAVWRKNGRIIEPLVVHAPPYAAAPAAVPEKVVKLPKLCVGVVQSGHAVMVPYKGGHWFNKTAIQEALDAAGVKWVEGE